MNQYKSDQLVIPISLPEGVALRVTAESMDIPYASLLRQIIRKGIENSSPEVKEMYNKSLENLSKLNNLQLLQAKQNLSKRPKNKL